MGRRSEAAVPVVLEATVDDTTAPPDLEARIEGLQEAFASLRVGVVDGYFTKRWRDAQTGEWVAECPSVQAVAQAPTESEVVEAIGELTREMLLALAEMGAEIPPKDVPLG
ncbi:MAG: hypothetical protein FJX74_18370 [Armatimonadetes bacterium]|nr:hypothetical protein [Armatimonadota bacterium]